MFNLFFLNFATEHSSFALPICTPLADALMLWSHRDQSWDAGYTKFTFMISLHIQKHYWQNMRMTLPSQLAIRILSEMHTHLQALISYLENVFIKRKIKVNPSKSQAVFFSKKNSFPPPLNLNDSPDKFGR